MKVSSICFFTCVFMVFSTGSSSIVAPLPPRLSSQLEDHEIVSMGLPSSCDTGRAVGWVFCPAGAESTFSYS